MKPIDSTPHYILSSSPHTHSRASVSSIMGDVILALLPTTFAGIWFFGLPAVWLIATCVSTCIVTEAVCRMLMKRENTIGDLSAVLTGLLLALNLPAGLPLWMAVVGSVFAIVICKQVFGGLGMNPFNPALAARAFMLISFTGPMTTWLKPLLPGRFSSGADVVTMATPLASIKSMLDVSATASATPTVANNVTELPAITDMLIGNMPGCIGEVSAIALLLGALYLLYRRVITWHIPTMFLLTVAVYAFFMGGAGILSHLLTGGVILAACFMATDYVTSPITAKGKIIFGCGCGLLCMLIRHLGSYPEGCSFAILMMNAFTPLIDRWSSPRPFGSKKGGH